MKTSNKILLALFLFPILAFSSISLALYAKYRAHQYVSLDILREDDFLRKDLQGVLVVVSRGVENLDIIPSDTGRLEIEKVKDGFMKFSIHGDTLFLRGDSTIALPNKAGNKFGDILRSSQEVHLYLPDSAKIYADYSGMMIAPGHDSLRAKSYEFDLTNASEFSVAGNDFRDSTNKYFKSLTLKLRDESRAELNSNLYVQSLRLELKNHSEFDDKDFHVGEFNLSADQDSRITLVGGYLQKINLKKQP